MQKKIFIWLVVVLCILIDCQVCPFPITKPSGLLFSRIAIKKRNLNTLQSNLAKEVDTMHASIDWLNSVKQHAKCKISVSNSIGPALVSQTTIRKGEYILKIPSRLCIYSDATKNNNTGGKGVQLLPSVHSIVDMFDVDYWRLRLAIMLLGEYANENSPLKPYLKLIVSSFSKLSGYFPDVIKLASSRVLAGDSLFLKQINRLNCLTELDGVLSSIAPTDDKQNEPIFSLENRKSLLFAAFALASSQSMRLPTSLDEKQKPNSPQQAVFIPFIHLLAHDSKSNCEVQFINDDYCLVALDQIEFGTQLSISRHPLSLEDQLCDFGISSKARVPCLEELLVHINFKTINAARAVANQLSVEDFENSCYCYPSATILSSNKGIKPSIQILNSRSSTRQLPIINLWESESLTEEKCNKFVDSIYFSDWQNEWLDQLRLSGSSASAWCKVSLQGSKEPIQLRLGDDILCKENNEKFNASKIFAFLRVLYAHSEDELVHSGADPDSLQRPEWTASPAVEKRTLLTFMGILSLQLAKMEGGFTLEVDALTSEGLSVLRAKLASQPHLDIDEFSKEDIVSSKRILSDCILYSQHIRNMLTNISESNQQDSIAGIHRLMSYSTESDNKALSNYDSALLWYRVHKKRMLIRMICSLMHLYEDNERILELLQLMQNGLNERNIRGDVKPDKVITWKFIPSLHDCMDITDFYGYWCQDTTRSPISPKHIQVEGI